ncbi:MAG: hypothetical protein CL840_02335 [Crocinitomicaceae bacterium]|nr:hypothetical protein [Crocinitomicaceae bacterium]
MSKNKNIWIFLSLITVAALSRLLPHPPNFTAIGSIALFGGVVVNHKYLKLLLPLGALLLSDIVLNNTIYAADGFSLYYPGMLWVYASFVVIAALGFILKKVNIASVLGGSILSAVFFFLFTNFGYWMAGVLYPQTAEGLMACYVAALPFFANTLMSTVLFSAILFGGYAFVDRKELAKIKA